MIRSESPSRRLHPLYLVFSLAASARNLLLPGLVAVFFAARNDSWEAWMMVLFLPAAFSAVARYISFRYRLEPDGLIVSGGVFTRFERHIPYDRIQNINLVQNIVHRMFGIGAIRIETASGDEPEASMEALSLEAIREIRDFHQGARDSEAIPSESSSDTSTDEPLLRLSVGEIAVAGIISNRGFAVVAAALGVLWNLDFAVDDYLEDMGRRFEQQHPDAPEISIGATIGLAVAGLFALILAMRILSILWMIVELHGYSMRRTGGNLELEYGLLTRIRATIPLRRVQHVNWRQSLLHRMFGRVEGTAVTAGDATAGGHSPRRARLAPILRADRADALMRAILPECTLDDLEWRTIPSRAWWRMFLPNAASWAVLCGVGAIWAGVWAAAVYGVVALVLLVHALRWTATMRWAISPETVACRSGWPARRTTVVRRRKIQSVSVLRSPFDRRRRMATVSLDTAGGSAWSGSLEIRFLDVADAEAVAEELRIDSARRTFEW